MNKYLLSICIPTRNQPNELKRTLESILPQINKEIEIVIGDDSAGPETGRMIAKQFKHPQIYYFRNQGAPGIDKNILKLTQAAHGKYVWWFGDDVMEENAVKYVFNILRKHRDIQLIWVNFRSFDSSQVAIDLGPDKFFKDRNQILEEIANVLGFASAIVFKKNELEKIEKENMLKFYGTGFINFYLVMHIVAHGSVFYYASRPLIRVYPTPAGKASYDGFQIFAIDFFNIVKNFQDKFDKKSIRKILAKNFSHVWRGILVGWLRGYASPKGKLGAMFKLYWNLPGFWIAAPFFILPKFFTKLAYFIYKKI